MNHLERLAGHAGKDADLTLSEKKFLALSQNKLFRVHACPIFIQSIIQGLSIHEPMNITLSDQLLVPSRFSRARQISSHQHERRMSSKKNDDQIIPPHLIWHQTHIALFRNAKHPVRCCILNESFHTPRFVAFC
jgi:hypothetical protein